ncbi:MAG: hypothetical protein VB046_00800 [Paludibacter sp.]|jgi:hypothetical protein|nr:hypothetical protein [Paludibacter sp.]
MKTFKQLIMTVSLFTCAGSLQSQDTKFCERITFDVDSIPVLISKSRSTSGQTLDSLYYVLPQGETISVSKNINYWGGNGQLEAFLDHMYYQRFDYNYQEMNDIVKYCIIFDNNLKIIDIRFLKRFHGVNDILKNYLMVYKFLSDTESHWVVEDKAAYTWYVYIGSHRFF